MLDFANEMNFTTHSQSSNNRPQLWKPVVLLFVFVLPLLSSYVYLTYERAQVRKSVKRMILQGMSDEQLVGLQFARADSASAVRWKHSREFQFRGEMYDIVRMENRGDSILFLCWKDNQESKLDSQLHALIDHTMGNHPPGKTTNHQLYKFYSNLYCSAYSIHLALYQSNTNYRNYLDDIYPEPYRQLIDPPPQPYTNS